MELSPRIRNMAGNFSLHLTHTHTHTHPHIHLLTHSHSRLLFPLLPPPPTSPTSSPHAPLWLHSVLKGKELSEHPGLKDTCQEMFSQRIRSPFLLSLLVDMYEEEVGQGKQESLGKALEVGRVTVGVINLYLVFATSSFELLVFRKA